MTTKKIGPRLRYFNDNLKFIWKDRLMKNKVKVLLAKLGLDIHNRGVLTVAKNFKDTGDRIYG